MLPRPSGSREDAALNRVVTRVLAGTHTTTKAIVAEPSQNSQTTRSAGPISARSGATWPSTSRKRLRRDVRYIDFKKRT